MSFSTRIRARSQADKAKHKERSGRRFVSFPSPGRNGMEWDGQEKLAV